MNNGSTKSTVRLSVSMPSYIYDQLMLVTASQNVSQFVAAAVSKKVADVVLKSKADPWKAFLAARNRITKINKKITIRQAIDMGRK